MAKKRARKRAWRSSEAFPVASSGKIISEVHLRSARVGESGSDEESEVILEDNVNCYNALLQSLQAQGGTLANVYPRRQRHQQGASSSDELDSGIDGIGHDKNPQEELRGSVSAEIESGKKGDNRPDDKLEDRSVDELVYGLSENESDEDGDEARVASGGQAAPCPDPFKDHVGRILVEDEVARLLEAKKAFDFKVAAAAVQGGTWVMNTSSALKDDKYLQAYAVKKRLQDSWHGLHGKSSWGDFESEKQCQFFSLCSSYQDILQLGKLAFKGDGQGDAEDLTYMDAYIVHILNHIVKTRDLITKNNEKLHRASLDNSPSDPPRDQGFTRPKVLVLLPFRSSALKFVDRLLKLAPLPQKTNVEHKARFVADFGMEDSDVAEEDEKQQETNSTKPEDFRALFSGNCDDHFRIGIKFTRKSVKLYSDFYSSDIILASPVGLITRIGEAEMEKEKDIDFLSSIEITVIDHTDVILMQNWSHVVSIFDHLNRIPAQQHGTDFMRVREWYLNGHAHHYRQSIILGSFSDAGVNALFHRACVNHAGKVKARCKFDGVLSKVALQVRQVFEKIECSLIKDADDSRFEFFVKQIFPRIKSSLQGGIMIYTRSYFDFVRLRNYLKSQSASFCLLGEYTKQSDVSRSRSWFYHGKRRILLYTERAHFFHRYKVRGINDLIFYTLPDNAHFYTELLNLLEGKENPSCTVLFSQYDRLQLERIVGSTRTKNMVTSANKLFMFC